MTVIGRNGISMVAEWARSGPSTQHGVLDSLSGPWQVSFSPNNSFNLDILAQHSAYIWAGAKRKANGRPFAVTATPAAAENWALQILGHSAPMAALAGCTPDYYNAEGALDRKPLRCG